MKRVISFLLFAALFSTLAAQSPYNNTWFLSAPDRPFVKLLVNKDAIYQLTADELLAQGHDFSQIQPDSIQVFYRGAEIPLTVEKDPDGRFASLTFYGRRNDGRLEQAMYRDYSFWRPKPENQPNPNFSLYSDTSAYFLTWGMQRGIRYFTTLNLNYAQYTPEASYPFERIWEPHPDSARHGEHHAQYYMSGGHATNVSHYLNSDFVVGEGYASSQGFGLNKPWITDFLSTPGGTPEAQDVRFKFRVFHQSSSYHRLHVQLKNSALPIINDSIVSHDPPILGWGGNRPERFGSPVIIDTNWNRTGGIFLKEYSRMFKTIITPRTDLIFSAMGYPKDDNKLISIRIRYQRQTDLRGKGSTIISEWASDSSNYFQFRNPLGNYKLWVYDPENQRRYEGNINDRKANIILNNHVYSDRLYLVTDEGFEKATIAPRARFRQICHADSGASFVMIAHRNLKESAEAYTRYRDTSMGNGEDLSVKLIYTDDIYEEFSFGSPSPQAIHQFVNCALDNWTVKPKYLFLWGKGNLTMRGTKDRPVVPSYGFPANDVRYTTPLIEYLTYPQTKFESQVAIGRLNLVDDLEGFVYLDKVIEFEKQKEEPWRKKGVFLGGGDQYDVEMIKGTILNSREWHDDARYLGGSSIYFQKGRDFDEFFQDSVEQGVGMIYYFGHASTNFNEVNLREASSYNSWGKYPMVIMQGCNAGHFTAGQSFSERWVLEPGRGSIAFLANSTLTFASPSQRYSDVFFRVAYGPKYTWPIGELARLAYQEYMDLYGAGSYRNHGMQMNLQGDPALVIYPFNRSVGLPGPELATVNVYPNPAQSRVFITSMKDRIEALYLSNLHGQMLIKQENLSVQDAQLEVDNLPAGHYILRYRTANGSGVEKIIVK